MSESVAVNRRGFDVEVTETICAGLAEGRTMTDVCSPADMPVPGTVYRWLGKQGAEYDELRERYADARKAGGHAYADQVMTVASAVLVGRVDPKAGRVAIEALKWAAAKLNPKAYGEKVDVNATIDGKVMHGVLAVESRPETYGEWLARDGLTVETALVESERRVLH